jgi:hypothetical protein
MKTYCALYHISNDIIVNIYVGEDYDKALDMLIDLNDEDIKGTIFAKVLQHWENGKNIKSDYINLERGMVI